MCSLGASYVVGQMIGYLVPMSSHFWIIHDQKATELVQEIGKCISAIMKVTRQQPSCFRGTPRLRKEEMCPALALTTGIRTNCSHLHLFDIF